MTLNDFWPPVDEDHTTKCLFTEAETAANEVFLAVHQRMHLTRELFSVENATVEVQSEQNLLDALLVDEPPSGTLVMPIVGDSGVGKSHMIRWLDAHLRLRADANRRHIVRIPKSSSLRGVLKLILHGLSGRKYDEIRDTLDSAEVPPSLPEAMYQLQGRLLFALDEAGKEARRRQVEQKARVDDRSRVAHCSPTGLMALIQEADFQPYFTSHEGEPETWGVLTRIADRCLHGSRRNDAGPLNQFLASDFQFLTDVRDASLSRVVQQYLPNLRRPAGLEDAIGFLNEVVDNALGGLVNLGGASLTDIFIDIRKALLADELELILLVEDFAVLAGLQGPLLAAMIREAIRDGKRELCTMRTALAVTEGKLPEETVKSRAQWKWRIDSHPFKSDNEAMECFENFVGGYLNAARWGARKLRQIFDERSAENASLSDWVPNFYEFHRHELSEKDNEHLRAFEFSPGDKHPLFPLNSGVVRQLAHKYLRVGDSYKFDPRRLINRLVRDTIINHRTVWENGAFPPGNFHNFEFKHDLDNQVAVHLLSKVPDSERKRVGALVYFWGNDPRSPGEAASMDPLIYDTFGLKKMDWQTKPIKREPVPPIVEPGPVVPEITDPLGLWREILDAWATTGLIQRNANKLRQFLADALLSWLDADSLLTKKFSIQSSSIYLPKTDQGPRVAEGTVAAAATDEDLNDDKKSIRFFAAMRAVVRFHTSQNWNYEGGENDAARYAALIGGMARQAEQWFAKRGSGLPAEAVKPLAQALLIGARLLNLEGASSNDNAGNLAAMLIPGPADSNDPMDPADKWSTAKRKAIRAREELRTALLEQVAARQGGGGEQAVDAARLIEAISELRKNAWQLPKELDLDLFKNLPPTSKEHLRELRDRLPSIVESRQTVVKAWRAKVVYTLGEDFDLPPIIQTVRATIKEAQDAGVFRWRDGTADTLRSRFDALGPVKATIDFATNADREAAEFGSSLSALAQLDEKCMGRVSQAISDYERFLNETNSFVDEEDKDTPTNLEEITRILDSEFESLSEHWSQITSS